MGWSGWVVDFLGVLRRAGGCGDWRQRESARFLLRFRVASINHSETSTAAGGRRTGRNDGAAVSGVSAAADDVKPAGDKTPANAAAAAGRYDQNDEDEDEDAEEEDEEVVGWNRTTTGLISTSPHCAPSPPIYTVRRAVARYDCTHGNGNAGHRLVYREVELSQYRSRATSNPHTTGLDLWAPAAGRQTMISSVKLNCHRKHITNMQLLVRYAAATTHDGIRNWSADAGNETEPSLNGAPCTRRRYTQ